jgi:hypothetical protein
LRNSVLRYDIYASNTVNKEMTMANWFDTVTKTLADSKLSRRQAITKAAGAVAAVALASVIPGEAFASSDARRRHCKPGTCSTGFTNCQGNANCYCFQKINTKTGACGCNSFCASIAPCSNQSQCSKGFTCITNTGCGCSTGVCIPNCSKTCHFPVTRSGRTAA